MRRLVTLLTFAALATAPACKKQAPPPRKAKSEAPDVKTQQASAPTPEIVAAPTPAPAPAPDALAEQAEVKDPWAEYNVIGSMDPNMGPAAPPVSAAEVELAVDLAKGWTPVAVARGENDPPPDISVPKEAALAPETLNNRALYVFEIISLENDVEYFVEKLLPEASDYLEFRNNLGLTVTADDIVPLAQHLRKEFAERQLLYGKYVGPVKREDRFGASVDQRTTRLTRYTFQYEDKSGAAQQDCLLFILLRKGWCVLDFGCDDEPWLRPADIPAEPQQEGDVVSAADAGTGADVTTQDDTAGATP